jgi:hypothetical protein
MKGIPKVWKVKKRKTPFPVGLPGWTSIGTQTRTDNSSKSAAYRNGSTANAAINKATSTIPNGTNIRPDAATNTTANQKPISKKIVTSKGRSELSSANWRPKTMRVSFIFMDQGPSLIVSLIGNFQAIAANTNIVAVPMVTISRYQRRMKNNTTPHTPGTMIQIRGELMD